MEENQGKIRKRGCSSSSSSSLMRKYRLKRAILIRKRVGSGTPKLRSPVSTATAQGIDLLKFPTGNERDGVVSARRLAATLWEINRVSSSPQQVSSRTREGMREVVVMPSSSSSSELPTDALPEVVEGSRRRRKSVPESQKLLVLPEEEQREGVALFMNGRLSEMETRPGFKDVRKGLKTAKELLKALSLIWDRHSSAAKSLVSALQVEIAKASVQMDQLAHEQRLYRREMRCVMQHLAEEKDKVRRVVELAGAELEAERKLRRQTERICKKLGRELADGKVRLDMVVKELEREKRTNDELEHVCEDRAEVEKLKRASAEAWEEVEMLQLADVLREERVQMKLAEAKYHFEEKNADIEKMRLELEAYMSNNHVVTRDDDVVHEGEESPGSANSEVLRDFLQKTLGKVCQNPNIEEEGHEDENRDSSSESDMHSIELEPDGSKKSFKWGYSPPLRQDDSKRSSVEVFKGRKSLSEKIQWATISLLKGSSTSITDNVAATPTPTAPQHQKNEIQDAFETPRSSSSSFHCGNKDQVVNEKIKERKSVKSLKKKILSSFKLGSSQEYTNPAKQWGQAIERF